MDTRKEKLENETDRILDAMSKMDVSSEEYSKAIKNFEMFRESQRRERVSIDTIVNVAASLASILLIMNHERLNVITTKALGFVKRST